MTVDDGERQKRRWVPRYRYESVLQECEARSARIPADPRPETAEIAITQMEAKLARASAALDSLSTKAAAILAGIVTVAAVIVTSTDRDLTQSPWALLGGVVAVGGAIASLGLAVATLWPEPHGNGPDPELLGPNLRAARTDMLRGVFAALDIAVTTTERLVLWKAWLLNRSMVAGLLAFVGIVIVVLTVGRHA